MVLRAVGVGLVLTLTQLACARRTSVQAPTVIVVEGVSGDPAAVHGEGADRAGAAGYWRPKEEVEVEWHGSWWPAVVVDRRGSNRWLVHYEGYGADWDEIVGAERIRERRAELQLDNGDEGDDDSDP